MGQKTPPTSREPNLKGKPILDVLLQRLGNGLVEVAQDLHRQLRVDTLITDEVVERVRQGKADAIFEALRPAAFSYSSSMTEEVWDSAVPAPTVQLVERLPATRHDGPDSCVWSLTRACVASGRIEAKRVA
jgi:hypothetical protein